MARCAVITLTRLFVSLAVGFVCAAGFMSAGRAQTLNWVQVTATGIPRSSSTSRPLYIYLTAPGDIYVDDITVVSGSTTNGVNVLTNGGFETGSLSSWTIGSDGNNSASVASTNFTHSGSYSLHLVASGGGSSQNSAVWQDMPQLTVGATYTLNFWYRQTTNANGGAFVVRFSNNGIVTSNNPAPLIPPDTNAPVIFSSTPAAGSTVGALTQVAVAFSEPVIGVDAGDLLVNGQPASTVNPVTGGGTNYTFTFTQPGPGAVAITWSSAHGITDLAGNPFDYTATNASWNYTLTDTIPPTVSVLTPPAGATINHLTQVNVTFSEAVTGVNASDLLVNGVATTNETGVGSGPYTFQFPQPPNGPVQFAWIAGHGIMDTASNAFAGGSWTNVLDPTATPTVRINEFLASNISTNGLHDQFGDLEDWIELYNYGSNAVNLAGYSLTDDDNVPDKWIFPSVTLGAGQFLVVFASELNLKAVGGTNMLHTSFTLGTAGDYLALFDAESPRVALTEFTPKYPDQRNDYSYGYDSSNQLRYFSVPTPGAPNGNSSISATVTNVTFSVQRGFYSQSFALTLGDATPGAAIRYTTDGSQPTEVNGTTYTNALLIDHLMMVRAAAFETNFLPSLVQTHTYIFLTNVLNQPTNPPGFPITTNWSGNHWPSEYGMNQQVVTNPAYSSEITNDLMAIPTLSIVMKQDEMFGLTGIYTNSSTSVIRPERACSVELINPDGTPGFQIDVGVKMHGGGSASTPMKHPLGLKFKGKYGAGKLNFQFFPDSPVDKFDSLVLRSDYNNHWTQANGPFSAASIAQRSRGGLVRDAFYKDLELAMGDFSSHSRYVHLYINGLYWGVYNPCEDLDSHFAASYLGGDNSDYDALKGSNSELSVDGDTNAYTAMLTYNNTGLANLSQYNQIKQYLDVVQYADYILLNFYGGNEDWGTLANWVAIRKREPGALFKYMCWDEERTLEGTNDTPGQSGTMRSLNYLSPSNLQSNLVRNAEYRLLFADRAYKFMFNGGVLSSNGIGPMWQARASQIAQAIVGESARWGDSIPNGKTNMVPLPYASYTTNVPYYSRNENWLGEQGRLLTNYFPYRTAILLAQLKAVGLYPTNADAPVFNQFGGRVPLGFVLTMSAPAGTIYYTTNGLDPRVYGTGTVLTQAAVYTTPLTLTTSMVVRARALVGTNWSALADGAFTVGSLGTPLRITELMYDPPGGSTYEFLEVQNIGTASIDIGSFTFVGISYTFPSGTLIAPGAVLLLANNTSPSAWATRYPTASVFGYFGGSLDNNGERIAILDRNGQVVTEVTYNNKGGWPAGAAGGGYSLELIDPYGDLNSPANWRQSSSANGTPGLPPTTPAPGNVVLNELMADNAGAVMNAGQFSDWLELANRTTNSVNLGNWSLSDSGNARKYLFPTNTILAPNGYLVVWCDTNNASPGLHSGFNLAKAGESLFLYDANTNRIDAVSFGQQVADLSLGRVSDIWQLTLPTTNAVNVAAPLAALTNVSINEWFTTGTNNWIELFNRASNAPVALHGVYLATSNTLFRVGTLAFLPPRGFLQVFADQVVGFDHADVTLTASNNAIIFYDNTANETERITYNAQSNNISEGRFPDGVTASTNRYFMPLVTPGAANVIPNNAPALTITSNRVVHLGQTVQFTATATDPDLWYQTLAFSLSNAPAGAAINSANGAFTWTASNVPVPSTNVVTVRVLDNGTPALADAKSFQVIVQAPLQFSSTASITNSSIYFNFNSVNGDTYQVLYDDDLGNHTWTPLGPPITGTGGIITLTYGITNQPQRYFRLVITSP